MSIGQSAAPGLPRLRVRLVTRPAVGCQKIDYACSMDGGDSGFTPDRDYEFRDARFEEDTMTIKVMVIDDSNTIRKTTEALLSRAGYQVLTARDGFEAMSVITDNHPDIIFVDIMMPRLDGYQTCTLIKNNRYFKNTPVIMLSSKDGLFDRARGRIVGSEQYLTKPFTKDELLGAISNQIN